MSKPTLNYVVSTAKDELVGIAVTFAGIDYSKVRREEVGYIKRVKIGIVGCGSSIDYMYGPIFKYLETGEFIAAMDVDKSKAKTSPKDVRS